MNRGKRVGNRRTALLFAAVCAAGLLISGCQAASESTSAALREEEYAVAEAYDMVEETAAASSGEASSGSGFYAADEVISSSAMETGREQSSAENETPTEDTAEEQKTDSGESVRRKLIKDVSMSVETKNFDSLIKSVEEKTESLGGYVESSYVRGNEGSENGEARYASIKTRIPAERLDEFLDTALTDANIIYKNESVTDITLQYTDTESRIKALDTEYDRLMELLSQADGVESIIALEERLSEIRYELESYNSQIRLYDNQVNYSTVTIDVSEVRVLSAGAEAGFTDRVSSGFMKNVKGVAEFLENALITVLSCIPVLLPAGIIIYIILRITGRIIVKGEKNIRRKEKKSSEKDAKDGGSGSLKG